MKFALLLLLAIAGAPGLPLLAGEKWDQDKAKSMIAKVLEVEKAGGLPWNRIPWRIQAQSALQESRSTGKPLFIFFFVPQSGPPTEPCGLEGRLLRTHVLSEPKIIEMVKARCIPMKIRLEKGEDYPVDWPALKHWATAFKFSNERGFAGCSVISSDLAIEFGNSGSARIYELLSSPAFDSEAILGMLKRAMERVNEERSILVQRGISNEERRAEILRFRKGVTRAVRSEGRRNLPPAGYSLEQALELYRVAGVEATK